MESNTSISRRIYFFYLF